MLELTRIGDVTRWMIVSMLLLSWDAMANHCAVMDLPRLHDQSLVVSMQCDHAVQALLTTKKNDAGVAHGLLKVRCLGYEVPAGYCRNVPASWEWVLHAPDMDQLDCYIDNKQQMLTSRWGNFSPGKHQISCRGVYNYNADSAE